MGVQLGKEKAAILSEEMVRETVQKVRTEKGEKVKNEKRRWKQKTVKR